MLFEPVTAEARFDNDGTTLVGDFVRPPWPGPYPAVVFVQGSGPGGRDLGSWPARLAAAGWASLCYDKPADWPKQTLHDRAAETVAAVRFVKRRSDVSTVALIGGSQGGWVAHLAASLEPSIEAIVTVSGPGVGVLEQEEYRLRRQLPAAGLSGDEAERAVALFREQIARVRAGEDPARVHASQPVATTPELFEFLAGVADYEPSAALKALRCPLLAIFGADDVHVPVRASVEAIGAHHHNCEIVVFPDADHGIRLPTKQRAPGFHELIVTWLHRQIRETSTPR